MLARWIRTWDSKILRPILILILKCGITPNLLTVTGLIAMIVSGFILARGDRLVGGFVLLLGALFDGIDGELARLVHWETRLGALLDSLSDHCGDFAVYLGLLWFSLDRHLESDVILIFVALFGSIFGSLVRSRAGMLGIDTKDTGLFTRFERIVILLLGLFAGRVTAALWVLAVFNNLSAFQRAIYVLRTTFSLRKFQDERMSSKVKMPPSIHKPGLSDKSPYPPLCLFVSLFCLLTFTGCASLPRFEEMYQRLDIEKPPKIIGPRGQLSPKMSKAVMESLKKEAGPTGILERHAAVVEAIGGSPLVAGNKVTLLVDGPATYDAMFKAIRNAKDHINLETYIFEDDEVGRKFADLLLQKQSEGVQVNVIYDSLGTLTTPAAFFQRLRDGGVQTLQFNPINPLKLPVAWLLTHRDHRKILIVDGSVAFTGGVNISRVYSSSSPSGGRDEKKSKRNTKEAWRDTHVRIEGPAVAEFQKLFLDTWAREEGPELSKRNYFPTLKREGNDLIEVVGSTPGQQNRLTYVMYVSAFVYAENFIHLTNSYFVPDKQTIKALTNAARRGVDVKIILPGISDEATVFYAGRSHYTHLLKSGVKLFEHGDAMLHAKTAVIDGVWSTIGSTNMDLWSFLRNDEVNAVILGSDFASEMETLFEKDIANSNQILLEQWKKRPVFGRVREWLGRLLQYWL